MKRNLPDGFNCEQLLEIIVHDSKDHAYLLADREGKIVYANNGAEIILGCQESELTTRTACEFFTPEDQSHNIPFEELQRATREGSVLDERWHIRADGTPFWATGVTSAVRDDSGRVVAFLKVFRNQTLRRKTEDKILHANSELLQFTALAAHDLQEPLRSVTSYLQLLETNLGDRLDERNRGFLQFALEGAHRMRTLITDLLSYAREGNEQASFELTECNAAFDAALANLQVAIESAKAKVSRGALPAVTGLPMQLQRLFQNLLANAIKFRSEAPPVVFVDAKKNNDEWIFSVRDNGVGIPEGESEKIFQPFKRAHSKDQYPGSGLGLAAAKKIVEIHQGRIWVESQLGKGTTFYFSLPVHLRGGEATAVA